MLEGLACHAFFSLLVEIVLYHGLVSIAMVAWNPK
jgi:hypothetical protein